MAYRIGKDGIENPTLKGWDKVLYKSRKHPRKVQWRACRTYKNYPAMVLLAMTSISGWIVALSIVGAIVYLSRVHGDELYWTYFNGKFTFGKYFWIDTYVWLAMMVWVTLMMYLLEVGCEKRYNNYCREKFIWPRDVSYYNVYVKDDEQLTIEEWKPVRYAYHLYQNESTMHHPFKVWYRNQCKRVVHFDKFCKLRNHLIT